MDNSNKARLAPLTAAELAALPAIGGTAQDDGVLEAFGQLAVPRCGWRAAFRSVALRSGWRAEAILAAFALARCGWRAVALEGCSRAKAVG